VARVPCALARLRRFTVSWHASIVETISNKGIPVNNITSIDIVTIQPLIALIFGILILVLPRLLNYLVAIYLIFVGLVGLYPHFFAHHV
jgi:hypothetical protein